MGVLDSLPLPQPFPRLWHMPTLQYTVTCHMYPLYKISSNWGLKTI